MTELYIDRQLVVLPENFTITIIEENPFFTKNGKYTYDISLSLLDPINARIYKHLNRINRKGDIPKNRSAYLVVDNEVMLNGTEVILEYTEREVKIQLVSGNSELNFLIGGDRKLRDLNLGEADVYKYMNPSERAKQVFKDLKKTYPERSWQFVPYAIDEESVNLFRDNFNIQVGNNFALIEVDLKDGDGKQIYPHFNPFCSGAVPQPYLCFIIKKILEVLGYKLTYNAIEEHDVFKNIYIVHSFRTTFFAKMLPSWTVVEFFSKIEQWLNCEFIIDPYKKTVRLMFAYQADSKFKKTEILEAIDEFVMELNDDNEKTVVNSNVKYSFDSEEYYKYMSLSDYIRNRAIVKDAPLLNTLIVENETASGGFEYIHKPINTEDRFISYRKGEGNNITRTLKKVDSFCPLYNNKESTEIDIELDIIPAAMKYTYINAFFVWEYQLWLQIPIAGKGDPLIDVDNPEESDPDNDLIDIQDAVEEDISGETEETYSKMRVAIYSGLQEMDIKTRGSFPSLYCRYPLAYTEALSEYFEETKQPRYFGQKDVNPFRLNYLQKEIYDKSHFLDTSNIFKIDFINNGLKDITARFIVKNKSFRCIKIQKLVTHKGVDSIIKGEFYPLL